MILKDFDKLTEQEKIKMTETAFLDFIRSLGPDDIFKTIVLEETFKFMMGDNDDE